MNHEYRLTVFVNQKEETMEKAWRSLRLKNKHNVFELMMEDTYFRITPFQNQPRSSLNGYRIAFNGTLEGCMYLLDTSFGWTTVEVTGVYCIIKDEGKSKKDWLDLLTHDLDGELVDARGLIRVNKKMVSILPEGVCIEMHAPKGKQLNTYQTLKEIDSIREMITPKEYDLFSFMEEEAL